MGASRYRLNLLGAFRMASPDGARLEITSRKGMALLALLATAQDGERTRAWLQDKLWGSRQAEQAKASLRRELSNLRVLFKDDPDLMRCGHDRVRLDLSRIEVDVRAGPVPEGDDFLEGLDIPGEDGFEDWLRGQRATLKSQADRALTADPTLRPPPMVDVTAPMPGFGGLPALAVLPFANLTGDGANDYLAEGMSEDLIDRLSRLRWLPVIARSSSFMVDPGSVDVRAVARDLGARYVLQGRLRRQDDLFRLSATLTEAETGKVLWSPRVTLPWRCSPQMLEELAADLVAVLDARIMHAEQSLARAKPLDDLSVHDLVWRARWHLNRFSKADSEQAGRLLDEALRLDPNSPEALIQATFQRGWSIWAERGGEARKLEMRRLAQSAILADPDDARAYMLAGVAESWLKNAGRAEAMLRQAVKLNPSLSMAHAELGSTLNLAGRPSLAIEPLRTALRLSPTDMQIFNTLAELATSYLMTQCWAEAVSHADEAIIRRPAYAYAHSVKITALAHSGDVTAALTAHRDLMSAKPSFKLEDLEWVPFVDRGWNGFLADGVRAAGEGRAPAQPAPAPVFAGG